MTPKLVDAVELETPLDHSCERSLKECHQARARILYLVLGGFFLVVLIILAVLIRFSFIFTSVSVERPTGFRRAWKETSGSGRRIFWVTFLASIPIGVIDRLLREITLAMEPAVTRLGGSYFDNMLGRWMLGTLTAQLIFTFLFTAVLVSALSLVFKDRTKWAPGTVSPATA